MSRILVATDFSDSSLNAFQFIKDMVLHHPMKVDLIHVFDIPIPAATALSVNAVSGMIIEREKAVSEHLQELQEELPEELRGETFGIHGTYPSTEIAEKADVLGATLIVMALREKYSFFEKMIGSTTAHTIQKANIPVLAVPNGVRFSGISKILFPTEMQLDGELDERELKAMRWLNQFSGFVAKPAIHMIHISRFEESVETIITDKPFPGMEFIVSPADSIESGILKYLEKTSADLLAVYKPNRSFWERLYHSSVTRKLLFHSRIPLLVFS